MRYGNKLKVKVEFLSKGLRYATEAIIDTGSTITIAPPEIADYLNFEVDKRNPTMTIVTGSGILDVPRKIADRIKIDKFIFTNIAVGVHELPKQVETKVIIGMNIINQIKLIVDGKNKEFRIE